MRSSVRPRHCASSPPAEHPLGITGRDRHPGRSAVAAGHRRSNRARANGSGGGRRVARRAGDGRPAHRWRSPQPTRLRSSSWRGGWTASRWRSSWRRCGFAPSAWTKLVERLNDRFRLLVGGSRTAPPRHQTLEATIAWSHDLLNGDRTSGSCVACPSSMPVVQPGGSREGGSSRHDFARRRRSGCPDRARRSFVRRPRGHERSGALSTATRPCASLRCCGSVTRMRRTHGQRGTPRPSSRSICRSMR